MALEGIDVSHINGTVQWTRVKAAGISFAYIKATEGVAFVDSKCSINADACRSIGITVGLYHFYHHDADPQVQATHFLKSVGTQHPGDLPPALDVEAPGDGAGPIGYSQDEVIRRVGVFVDAVERTLSRPPIIYTYPSAWQEMTGGSDAFAATCPLWVASYKDAPTIPKGWANYSVWQYTDRGHVDGISTIVDRDRLVGDELHLEALGKRVLEKGGLAILSQDGNVRVEAGLSGALVSVLKCGAGVVIVDGPEMVKDREWWKVDDGEGTVGWCSGKLLSPA